MKVSIITVCFNSSPTILDTINSVNIQDYKHIEHIFIDGGSSDDTLSIIKSNCNSCHGANGDQTNFVNYDNAKTVADGILNRIQLEEGTPGFMQRNGSKLSQEDINLIKQWKTDGLF